MTTRTKQPPRKLRSKRDAAVTVAQPTDTIGDLLRRASRGDCSAVWAVSFFFGRSIREQIEGTAALRHDADSEIYQAVLLALLDGRSPYSAEHGPALEWLRRRVRVLAEHYRELRELDHP